MSFYDQKKELAMSDITSKTLDLGLGTGDEIIWFRSPTFAERQKIFASRVVAKKNEDTGLVENHLDIQANTDFMFQAEVVSTLLITPDKKQFADVNVVKTWKPRVVDALYIAAMEALAELNANSAENPSSASQTQSTSGSPSPSSSA